MFLPAHLHPFPLQSPDIRPVCGGAIPRPAAVSRLVPREGDLCRHELPRPLPGAERPDPQGAHHLQQVSQRHRWAVRRHHSAPRESGETAGEAKTIPPSRNKATEKKS